jgi:hypothetical protein
MLTGTEFKNSMTLQMEAENSSETLETIANEPLIIS